MEPIIERSSGMAFGSFNGAYLLGHAQASMQEAKLIPEQNLWYAIYDFNPLPLDSKMILTGD